MKKKLVVLTLAGAMAVTSLTGCGNEELVDSEVAITVNGDEITADIANFYARFTQSQYETYYAAYYGEDMWGSASDESSYQYSVKTTIQEALENMYLMEDHMAEYEVEITEEDEAEIAEAAKKFNEDNSSEDIAKISGSEETVAEVLKMLTIQTKVNNAIAATADLEVSDEEAAQMKMEFVVFPFSTTDEEGTTTSLTEDEIADLKVEVEAFAEGAKDAKDFAAYATEQGQESQETTFDAEEEQIIPAELAQAAAALEEGGTTGLVESDNGYYVARLVSAFDADATEAEKEIIRSERMQAKVDEVLAQWREEAEISVDEKVWKKIDFDDLSVTMHIDETAEYSDPIVTDDVAEEQGAE